MKKILTSRFTKPIVFLLCLLPLAWLAYRWDHNDLGINRVETVARYTGDWTLRFLLISLAITPLRRITGWSDLIRFRRMFGLFAFFHGTLHMLHYFALDKQWIWEIIVEDFEIRRFYIMGLIAYTCMVPLALTSYAAAIRKMGGKRWRLLHRLAYASAIAGVIHFIWQGKALLLDPLIYAVIVAILLGYRMLMFAYGKIRRPRTA